MNNNLKIKFNENLFKMLLRHINKKRKLQICLLFLMMLLVAFFEMVSIGAILPFLGVITSPVKIYQHPVTQPLIQFLRLSEPKELLLPLTIIFVVSVLISGIFRLALNWVQLRLSASMELDFSANIYRNSLYLTYQDHLLRNSSELISLITTKASGVVNQTILPSLIIISSSIISLSIFITLVIINPVNAFFTISLLILIYVIIIKISRNKLNHSSKTINLENTKIIKLVQESLGGIRDIIIDDKQKIYCQIFNDTNKRLGEAKININIISVSPKYIIEALGLALIALMAYKLADEENGLVSAIPLVGAIAMAGQRVLPLLQQMYSNYSTIIGSLNGLRDALESLEQINNISVEEANLEEIYFDNHICISNLSYQYTTQLPWVLKNINLKIPKGSRFGFIGSTGSGKSTLLDIIMGLLVPSAGSILIDNKDINSKNCRAWQARIAHVPQSIFLSDSSITENIAFGVQPDLIDFSRVQLSAKQAQISDTIELLQFGYDTFVGERGVKLSGGQRQRIGIARALYKQADVIIFDEATSALDGSTENAVMDAIKCLNNDITILIVAHRLTTLRDCTHIVEIDNGSISRVGTYRDLID